MKLEIQENVPLAPLTTLDVGGAARFLIEVRQDAELVASFHWARERNLPVFILGGGSNLLISEAGFQGLVIKINLLGCGIAKDANGVLFTARAGENWDAMVEFCVSRNFAGIECLSGIPGTTGATPIQNVGAYGQEVAETISRVRVFDCETFEIYDLNRDECGFAYRTSIFNTTERNRFVVLAVTFRLRENGEPAIRYADLQRFFAGRSAAPTLADAREAVLEIRAAKSMVIRPEDENRRSAGSFFKNPIVGADALAAAEATARQLNLIAPDEKMPHFAADGGAFKIPAAWLIEKSGFEKGYARGRVGLSTRHTLAIVNRGGATANEIIDFMTHIQLRVRETFGVSLQPEPIFLGF